MSKLEEREARRKQSIVGSMITEGQETEQSPAEPEKKKSKGKVGVVSESEKKDRVQRAYWLDKDLEKALRRKSLEEDKNLTEAVNEALRRGLADYL